ncbi:MAG: type II secretion system F family protein [Bacteroidota bacterium]
MIVHLAAALCAGACLACAVLYAYPAFQSYLARSAEERLRHLLPAVESEKGRGEIKSLIRLSPWLAFAALAAMALLARSVAGVAFWLVVAFFGYRGPILWQRRLRRLQDEKLLAQLPDALNAVANALRAGQTLATAFEMVGARFKSPIRAVFGTVHARHSSGEHFEVALRAVFQSLGIEAFDYTARALAIHGRRGGPAYDLLGEIRAMVIEQDRCDRVVKATTASGRYTIKFLTWAPVYMVPLIMVLQQDFLEVLLSSLWGFVCLAAAAGIYLFAIRWAKDVLAVERI